jgi:hypothetical protein
MSPQAISRRLEIVDELRELAFALRDAKKLGRVSELSPIRTDVDTTEKGS